MSVIVYKDGRMAADSRAFGGDSHPIGYKRKIHRLEDGTLLGITSDQVGMPEAFKEWVEGGEDREDILPNQPSLSALKVTPDGRIYLYDDGYTPSGPLTGEFFTIGSGRKYAMGALEVGVEVEEAVAVAIKLDAYCGGPIYILNLDPKKD